MLFSAVLISVLGLGSLAEAKLDQTPGKPNKVWTVATGHDWGGHEYMDPNGYLGGFLYELIAEVCAAANIECRTIWDKASNCWDSEPGQHSFAGRGLISGWYDACIGWTGTVDRIQVFDFSMAMFPPSKSFFYKKKGTVFDVKDITGKKIGFKDGHFADAKCLSRQSGMKGIPLAKENTVYYEDITHVKAAIKDGTVDAAFILDTFIEEDDDIEEIKVSFSCSSSGDAMMTRKDNDFNAHWNRGFQQLMSNGRFKKLCREAPEKHGEYGEIQPCI